MIRRFYLNAVIFLGAAVTMLSLSGCATTQGAVKSNVDFPKYKKMYMQEIENDERKIVPRVKERLEKLGFQVIMLGPNEQVGGRQGSGIVLTGDGYVLTSGHVIDDAKEATLWLDGARYEADVLYKAVHGKIGKASE